MIGYYNYTVLFTLFGTLAGLIGIREAVLGNLLVAIFCLMISGFFDMFDGTIARTKRNRTEFEKKYGVQLDSLSDVICFGVLPTMIALEITKPLGMISFLCIIYLVTSISRLAYFNVEEELRTRKEQTPRKNYTGFPVTLSAIFIPIFYLLSFVLSNSFATFFLLFFLLLSMLQVSKIKLPHLDLKGLILCLVIGIFILSILMILFL